MNVYGIYANATKLLCANAFGSIGNFARFNERVSRLYDKISRSQLTVYQKESLLLQLEATRNLIANTRNAAKPQYVAAKSHSKNELLAA